MTPFEKKQAKQSKAVWNGDVSNKVLTIPNLISFIRLCLIPVFFTLLMQGSDALAALAFALAAGTDWIDGQIARRTNAVSRLGQLLDPTVDRLLMITGVIGIYLVGRLPLWIIVLVLGRDLCLLAGGAFILSRYKVRVDVIYAGKVSTTFFFLGFVGLLMNWPLLNGLGLPVPEWFPGFTAASVSWGIWFVYAGLALGACTTVYYIVTALRKCREATEMKGAE
jgi:cardiolipin synthase